MEAARIAGLLLSIEPCASRRARPFRAGKLASAAKADGICSGVTRGGCIEPVASLQQRLDYVRRGILPRWDTAGSLIAEFSICAGSPGNLKLTSV